MAGVNTKGKMEITQLDFDTIKANLKTYLKGQTTLQILILKVLVCQYC